ncbi:hypothetical protein Lal_00014770 [Lupinus albus]|nr:hypothetical protein Lal_00014770 [Lupinus albus]
MDFTTVLFYVFSAVMVLAGLRVITAKNPVHAALFLVLAFFNAAGIWMLLKAEFLAIVLVLVYVGAVMVLFLLLGLSADRVRRRRADRAGDGRRPVARLPRPGRCAGRVGRGPHRRHPRTGPPDLHPVHLRFRDRRPDPAGRHHRRRGADPAQAQGHQSHRPGPRRPRQARTPRRRNDPVARSLPDPGRDPVRDLRDRHFPEPEEHHHPVDGHRTDAVGGEPELCGVLALSGRRGRADLRVLHPDCRGRRVGDRPGDPGGPVP